MNFYPGQRVMVQHVSSRPQYTPRTLPGIPNGTIVVIREVDYRALGLPGHPTPSVRLEGIVGPMTMTTVGLWETAYGAEHFRPLDDRKTDISIFTEMLKTDRVPALPKA